MDDEKNRWLRTKHRSAETYDDRFDRLAAAGENVHGEVDFVSSYPGKSVLDAGCGTGRVAIELNRRGYASVGVDLDSEMLAVARAKAPHIEWIAADLATVVLDKTFDIIVLAGNVMIFLTPGTEQSVLANMRRHVDPTGIVITGFTIANDQLSVADFDLAAKAASFEVVERFSTWGRAPYVTKSDYAVSVLHATGSD